VITLPSTCKSHQSFQPCDDSALSAIELLLLTKELLLQLNNHRM
jgi:hypothetical protein